MKIVATFKSTTDKISVCYYTESQTPRLNDYHRLLGFFYQEEPLQQHRLLSEPKELWIIISSDTQNSYWSCSTYFIQLTGIDSAAEYDGEPITSLAELFQ